MVAPLVVAAEVEEAVVAEEAVVLLGMLLPLECLDSNQVHNTQERISTFRSLHNYKYKLLVVAVAAEEVVEYLDK
jgi:fumarate reductase subunit D